MVKNMSCRNCQQWNMHLKLVIAVLAWGAAAVVEPTRTSRSNSSIWHTEPGLSNDTYYLVTAAEKNLEPGQNPWYSLDWMWFFSDMAWSYGGDIPLRIPNSQSNEKPANYTTACSNASGIFQSPLVFTNCLALAVTTTSVQDDQMQFDEESVQRTEPVLHFGSLSSFPGLPAIETIASCLLATCQDTNITQCTMASYGNFSMVLDTHLNTTTRIRALYDGAENYCPEDTPGPSSDVVGPGVLIAYFTQCTLVVLFFIISKLDHVIHGLLYLRRRYWGATASIGRPSGSSNPKSKRIRAAIARHSTAVASVAVDFQEAQIFFVLTIQIAALWFYGEASRIRNSKTLAEADAIWFAVPLAGYGIIPVLLGQALLQRSGRHWWYTFTLASVTSVVTWYCFAQPEHSDYAALWAHFKETNPIVECGGNPSPATFCQVEEFARNPFVDLIISGAGFLDIKADATPELRVVLNYSRVKHLGLEGIARKTFIWATIFLFVDQTYSWAPRLQYWSRLSPLWTTICPRSRLSKQRKKRVSRTWSWVTWLAWATLQAFLVVSLVYFISFLGLIFVYASTLKDQWSYGQLVAVLVWVPVVFKLLYHLTFGVKKGAENRLGDSFEVRAKDQDKPKITEHSTMNAPLIPQEVKYESIQNLSDDAQCPWDHQYEKGLALKAINDDQSADLGYSPRHPVI
ncbi:hypothetical protein F5Y18DRAFT_205837 [Xylariaceae sp. FL1019]|nr:hypothetical protein F5Y18DRAFT_205837 [Xylariaceae sp. FL1019]